MKTLFEPPLAHRDDPITSFEAAEKMIKSGKLSRQEKNVLISIRHHTYGGHYETFTAKELAKWMLGDTDKNYFIIQRRLSSLRNKGKIERIQIGKERIGATNTFKPIYEKRDGCCVWRLI